MMEGNKGRSKQRKENKLREEIDGRIRKKKERVKIRKVLEEKRERK